MMDAQVQIQAQAQALADRYAALWNEPDLERRRAAIEALWHPQGMHFVRTQTVQGHAGLLKRVTGSWERSVRDTGNRFVARQNSKRLENAITFNWEMIGASNQKVLARGLEFILLDEEGRIRADYQFNLS